MRNLSHDEAVEGLVGEEGEEEGAGETSDVERRSANEVESADGNPFGEYFDFVSVDLFREGAIAWSGEKGNCSVRS